MLGVAFGRRGHEGEDCVEGEGADEGEAVYVAEMDFAGEKEEGAEEEEEEDGAREVGVVHYVLGDGVQRVEYRERLYQWSESLACRPHISSPLSNAIEGTAALQVRAPRTYVP